MQIRAATREVCFCAPIAALCRGLYPCFHSGHRLVLAENDSDMVWASAVSQRVDSRTAIKEALRSLLAERAQPPDLLFAFLSSHHAPAYDLVSGWLRSELPATTIVGCSAAGVIGAGSELEGREAISLTGAWLPGIRVRVAHVEGPIQDSSTAAWIERLGLSAGEPTQFMLLIDPYTYEVDHLLQSLDGAFPGACKVGGLASGGAGDQPVALFNGADVHRGGALVVAFQGAYELRAVVSQGCRPVGEPFIVTRVRGNVIKELNAGRPAEVLRKTYEGMNARDHALFNTSLFLGIDLGDNRSRYQSGDFLIRNVLGIDPESGAMAIDARVNQYQVVQFHMRDRETAAQDLSQRLRELTRSDVPPRIRGALLFSCLGRGERLYGTANHDSDAFLRRVGPVSLSGFFSNGEIGPVGARTCLHGYTSVFAVFCSPT
jgi:small ligand-binding sensory domain FIST